MTAVAPAPAPAQPMGVVAFDDGTYEYSEPMVQLNATLTAVQQELPAVNITPGGFLRGVSIFVTAAGGVLGTGVLSPDAPFSIFNYLTLESIDGTPILYPMDGYACYLASRYTRPWVGDPALEPAGFSNTINPAFRLNFAAEARATLGTLPNTDARAQYRLRWALNPLSSANPAGGLLTTLGTATTPTLTIIVCVETYAQPPRTTLTGQPIQQSPDGIGMQRFVSREIFQVGSGSNTIKSNRVGNLIRNQLLLFRDSTGVRTDLTADPIRERIDATQLLVEQRARRDHEMWQLYNAQSASGVATATRPTGLYAYPRYQLPGQMRGQGWLETSEATFQQYEFTGAAAGGSLQIITEDLAPVFPVPAHLENI